MKIRLRRKSRRQQKTRTGRKQPSSRLLSAPIAVVADERSFSIEEENKNIVPQDTAVYRRAIQTEEEIIAGIAHGDHTHHNGRVGLRVKSISMKRDLILSTIVGEVDRDDTLLQDRLNFATNVHKNLLEVDYGS